jgi:hypothetical protein
MKDYPGFLEVNNDGEVLHRPVGPEFQDVWKTDVLREFKGQGRPGAHVIPVVITDNARRTKIQNTLDLFDEFSRRKRPLTFGGWLRSQAEKEKITNTKS